jgi:DNA-binding response OmpR family regulator
MISPRRTRHVLVIDDDALIRTLAAGLLEVLGWTSVAVADGAQARAELAQPTKGPIDAVLLDLNLEKTSGIDVCRALRAEGITIPIVCVSADAFTTDRSLLEAAGFDDVLTKPFAIDELRDCIERHVDRARPAAR